MLIAPKHTTRLSRRHAGRLGPEPRHPPQPIAPLVERKETRDEDQRQEARHAARPVDAQAGVHVRGEEREHGARNAAQHGAGGQRRRGVPQVRVHNVVGQRHVQQHHAEAKECARGHADHERQFRRVGPREPE